MKFFLARVTGGLLALLITVFAFLLQVFLRKKDPKPLPVRIFAAIGAVASLYHTVTTVTALAAAVGNISTVGLLTTHLPRVLFALTLVLLFAAILIWPRVRENRWLRYANAAAAIVAAAQTVLYALNIALNWSNLTAGGTGGGRIEFLYLQIALTVFAIADALLFFLGFRKNRKAR